ncbi:3003_t:CDS:2 [Diversispora eburnea]|uniref:3003_t:CDS:1 n=1 Tax=Diversispora eburnea TaxID=1213867 RepID=A0A9N8VKN9_9GLOM|nr:3003_t:CDS:2 [Diversispora eburnea]
MSTIKFTPLNAPSQSKDQNPDPIETHFRQCEKEYNLALRRSPEVAKETYVTLLRYDIMKNPLYQVQNFGVELASRITKLKYCIQRNYAEILEKEYETIKTKNAAQKALKHYWKAVKIDSSDHSIWIRIGKLAMSDEINDREIALYAFSQALKDFQIKQNPHELLSAPIILTPHHRVAFEELCRILYDFGDFPACLDAVDKGLMVDPYNSLLLQLRYQLLSDTWIRFSLPTNYYDNAPPIKLPINSKPIPRRVRSSGFYQSSINKPETYYTINITEVSWLCLGETLLHTFDEIMSSQSRSETNQRSQRILIETQAYHYSNNTASSTNEASGAPNKRKRKSETTLEEDRTYNGRVNRWASKKTETIETFNRQRDEAASDFTGKIINIMKKFDVDHFLDTQQLDVEDQIDKFLGYFSKIWTFRASNDDHGNMIDTAINRMKQKSPSDSRYYLFAPNTNPPPSSQYFNEISGTEGILFSFIEKLNNLNSGIVDCLCLFVTHLLGSFISSDGEVEKSLWLCRWPNGLKEVVREMIQRIDMELLSILDNLCKHWDEKDNCAEMLMNIEEDSIARHYKQKMEILMGIYELLLDTQISWTCTSSAETGLSNFNSSEMSSGLQFTLTNYIDCFIRSSFYMSNFLTIAESQAPKSGSELDKWNHSYKKWKSWASQLSVRYWWCAARMELWKGALDTSMTFLETCKITYLSGDHKSDIVISNFAYDSIINISAINRKAWIIESRKDQPQDEWTLAINNLADSIKFLHNWVSDSIDNDRVILFWTIISSVNESITKVIQYLSNKNLLAKLSEIDRKKFSSCFRFLFRISLEVLFPRSLLLKEAMADIIEPMNILCVRTWILFSYLLKEKVANKLADDFAEFLEIVHDQLGDRHICGIDNGNFLKLVISTLQILHPKDSRFQEYQCCHCLFRVSLSLDSTPPNDHQTPTVDLDQQTAQLLLREIRNYLNLKSRKSYKTWAIKNDIKETLDKIANLVSPPSENRFSKCSWRTQHFLDDDINFYDAVRYREHSDDITDLERIADQDNSISHTDLSDLYYFRGKILLNQFKTRSKPNATKAMETLDKAIEQFTFDIRSNPLRFASWYALGLCYANLANETLSWSAEEIINNRDKITNYQKKSFNCFIRAAKVIHWFPGRNLSTPQIEVIRFWRDFGYHVYSMMTEPMSMEAFALSPAHSVSWRKPTFEQACQFSAACFGRALQLEIQTPESSGITGQEKILDAEYKLTSSLAKYLITSKIKPSFVEKTIGDLDNEEIDYSNEGEIFNIQKPEYQRAYDLICSKLDNIRKADKNKWYHRPVFRQAWLTFHVEQKPDEGKSILQSLFQLKTHISKPMMNVWRPEFERAGRHYVYVHEYILLLIDLARVTEDMAMLETMEVRLARSIVVLLKPEIIRINMKNAIQYVEKAQQQPLVSVDIYGTPGGAEQTQTPFTSDNQEDIEGVSESSNQEYESVNNYETSNVMSVAALISHDDDSPMAIGFVDLAVNDVPTNDLVNNLEPTNDMEPTNNIEPINDLEPTNNLTDQSMNET